MPYSCVRCDTGVEAAIVEMFVPSSDVGRRRLLSTTAHAMSAAKSNAPPTPPAMPAIIAMSSASLITELLTDCMSSFVVAETSDSELAESILGRVQLDSGVEVILAIIEIEVPVVIDIVGCVIGGVMHSVAPSSEVKPSAQAMHRPSVKLLLKKPLVQFGQKLLPGEFVPVPGGHCAQPPD